MKTFIFGHESPQTVEKRSIVLESPAFGISNGKPCKSNYRFVLLPDGDGHTEEPLFKVEQQFKSGEWGPTGGAWNFQTVWEETDDTISLQGQHWAVSGMIRATIEAHKLLDTLGL